MNAGFCGKCLHSRHCHYSVNGHLMYCVACQKLCDLDEYNMNHKPTSQAEVMRIGALKQ